MFSVRHTAINETARRLTAFAAPYKWSFFGSCVLGFLTGLADTAGVAAIIYLLFSVVSGETHFPGDDAFANMFGYLDTVSQQGPMAIIVLVLFIICVRTAGSLAYMRVARSLTLNAERSIRKHLLKRYLSAEIDDFVRKHTGRIINNIQTEATHVAEFLYVTSRLIVAVSYLTVTFLVVLATSWQIATTIVTGALIHGLLLRYTGALARRTGQQVLVDRERITAHAAGAIRAFKSIRVSSAERQMVEKLDTLSGQYAQSMFRLGKIEVLAASLGELALFGILGLVLLVAVTAGLHMATTIGVIALVWKARTHLTELERSLIQINVNLASLRSVDEELAAPAVGRHPDRPCKPVSSLHENGPIIFERVGYRYPGATRNALDNVSFTIPPGSTCAILGKSGAGKTTLVNLLLKLCSPTGGRIIGAGSDIRHVSPEAWLSVAGAAGQDLELFEGTLRSNLTLGLDDVDDISILNAMKIAEAADVVAGNPDGLDADIGKSGMTLSGGQRQRLVLARALLRKPKYLILDESTNAVDSDTETRILANIRAAFPDITLIVIAHRNALNRQFDYFVELAGGRVNYVGPIAAGSISAGMRPTPGRREFEQPAAAS